MYNTGGRGGAPSDYETATIKRSHSQRNSSLMAGSSTMIQADLDLDQLFSWKWIVSNPALLILIYKPSYILDNILKITLKISLLCISVLPAGPKPAKTSIYVA